MDRTRPPSHVVRSRLTVLVATALLLAACGGEDSQEGAPAGTGAPTATASPSANDGTAATADPESTTSDRASSATDDRRRTATRPERTSTTGERRPRPASTTSAPPPPTPTSVDLPDPVDPPQDAEATEPVVPLGTLAIPKIGVQSTMHEGIRLPTFDLGPGHWPGSAMPGQQGNMIIGGHRTSANADFRYLDALVPGDEMVMTTNDGATHSYRVDSVEITDPFALRILEQTPAYTATLFACHPPGSIQQRIVVHLTLA